MFFGGHASSVFNGAVPAPNGDAHKLVTAIRDQT